MGSGGGGTSRKHHKGEQVEVGERTERTARESKGEGAEGGGIREKYGGPKGKGPQDGWVALKLAEEEEGEEEQRDGCRSKGGCADHGAAAGGEEGQVV